MVLLPAQTPARRQGGRGWVMAVSAYTIGDLTVWIRATAKSWSRGCPPVRLLLAEPRTTILYSIGEQTDQWALLVYQRSSFRTAYRRTYPMVVCTRLLIALKPRLKQRKKRQAIRILA